MAVRDRHSGPDQRLDGPVQAQSGDRVGGARGVRRRALGEPLECGLESGLGHGLLADGDSPAVGRPLEHQRDPEPLGQPLHHVVPGQDELGAALDDRPIAEGHRPDPAPHAVARLEHGHLRSAGAQGVGRGEAREAGTDDDDPLHSSPPRSRFTVRILPGRRT